MRSKALLVMAMVPAMVYAEGSAQCWTLAEQATGIDRYLLYAVSQVESGHSTKALAVAKKGVWLAKQPASLDQAISWAMWLDQNGYTFAVGATQINWKAHGPRLRRQGITLEGLYRDPCLQIMEGAKILKDAFDSEGVNWSGVGAYYTGTGRNRLPWERYNYARKVHAVYAQYLRSPPHLTLR